MCDTFFNDKFSKIPMLSKNKYAGFYARFNHGAGFENRSRIDLDPSFE